VTRPADIARRHEASYRDLAAKQTQAAIELLQTGDTIHALAKVQSANRAHVQATACRALAEELETL
jgi:hypothetical protein